MVGLSRRVRGPNNARRMDSDRSRASSTVVISDSLISYCRITPFMNRVVSNELEDHVGQLRPAVLLKEVVGAYRDLLCSRASFEAARQCNCRPLWIRHGMWRPCALTGRLSARLACDSH